MGAPGGAANRLAGRISAPELNTCALWAATKMEEMDGTVDGMMSGMMSEMVGGMMDGMMGGMMGGMMDAMLETTKTTKMARMEIMMEMTKMEMVTKTMVKAIGKIIQCKDNRDNGRTIETMQRQ